MVHADIPFGSVLPVMTSDGTILRSGGKYILLSTLFSYCLIGSLVSCEDEEGREQGKVYVARWLCLGAEDEAGAF